MKRVFAMMTAITAFATFPLHAADDPAVKDYAMHQGGAWPKSWPAELDPLRRFHAPSGRKTFTFQRILPDGTSEPLIHYGIACTTREEFESAWPHLLKVKSKGAPIILRRGPSFWLGGASHGVCVHTPAVGAKPLSAEELRKSPWKSTSYIELIVDGQIVDLNRIALPSETPIIDERFKDGDSGVKHNNGN